MSDDEFINKIYSNPDYVFLYILYIIFVYEYFINVQLFLVKIFYTPNCLILFLNFQ